MAEIVRMPKLSDTMTEGVVAKWNKKVGDAVKFAEESPLPPVDELYLDVYRLKDYPFIKD
jgi:pyruvate dehydrogenase E2 component (dihydrolipoamide acetyltransferase)